MLTIDVTFEEWNDFEELSKEQMTPRWWDNSWVGVFTVNSRGHEWSFARWGNTPRNERCRLGIGFVEKLKQAYLTEVDRKGGRVFVKRKGAFFKPRTGKPIQFTLFRFPGVSFRLVPDDEGLPLDDGIPAR
jgi:hypothetical protein